MTEEIINQEEEIQEEPEQSSRWTWIGSPDRPEAKKSKDGISDLFEVDDNPDTDDLVTVDMEADIIDGDLEDLTEVTEEDVMGDELGQTELDYKPTPQRRPVSRPRRIPVRYNPPPSIGGIR